MLPSQFVVLILCCAVAAIHDKRRRTIPNWVTYSGFVAALWIAISQPVSSGQSFLETVVTQSTPSSLSAAFCGAAVCCTAYVPSLLTRSSGCGDMKISLVIGALVGSYYGLLIILLAATFAYIAFYLGVCKADHTKCRDHDDPRLLLDPMMNTQAQSVPMACYLRMALIPVVISIIL